MSGYGERLCNPYEERIYEYFDKYFDSPTMTKIKNVSSCSVYMTKVYCLLVREHKYIIVFVNEDFEPIKSTKKMSELPWISLQTRMLSDNHNIPMHSYQPKSRGPLSKKISRTETLHTISTYKCDDFPITVTLLHKKEGDGTEYQPSGTIVSAIETYRTIITID